MAREFVGTQVGPDGRRYPIGEIPAREWADLVPNSVRAYGQPEDGDVPLFVNGEVVWANPLPEEQPKTPPVGYVPAVAGGWMPSLGSSGFQSVSSNAAYFSAVEVSTACHVDSFGFNHNGTATVVGAGVANLALYRDDGTFNHPGGTPLGPVVRATAFANDVTVPMPAPLALEPGRYWVGFLLTNMSSALSLAVVTYFPVVTPEALSQQMWTGWRGAGATVLGDVAAIPSLTPTTLAPNVSLHVLTVP